MTRRVGVATRQKSASKAALAAIISSTRRKTRSLPLTEVARWVRIAVAQFGSYKALSEKVGVSDKMLRQFSYVNQLAPAVIRMFARRKLDSVDAAAHLKLLPCNEQATVARGLASGELDTSDVRAIAQQRRVRKRESIRDIISNVKDSKTEQHYVAEFIVRGSNGPAEVRSVLSRCLSPETIVSITINGPIGRLTLTSKGKAELSKCAKRLRVPFRDVLTPLLRQR